jgi:hypothetical protein
MRLFLILSLVLLCGCSTTIDSTSFLILTQRVQKLEEEVKELKDIKKEPIAPVTPTMPTMPVKVEAVETKTVWIKNSNESTTPIILTFKAGRWQGMRGEFYNDLPSQRTLEKVYAF